MQLTQEQRIFTVATINTSKSVRGETTFWHFNNIFQWEVQVLLQLLQENQLQNSVGMEQ